MSLPTKKNDIEYPQHLYDINLERSVIASIISFGYDSLVDVIKHPECFTNIDCCNIFKAMKSLRSQNCAIDLMSVISKCSFANKYQVVTDISINAPTSFDAASSLALTLLELYGKRKIYLNAFKFINHISINSYVDYSIFDRFTKSLESFELYEHLVSSVKSSDIANNLLTNREQFIRKPTKIKELDNLIYGFKSTGEIIIIGGRPGKGKSQLALQLAINKAKAGELVYFFSMEMSAQEIIVRVISNETGTDDVEIERNHHLTEFFSEKFAEVISWINNIVIFDSSNQTIDFIRSKCISSTNKPALIVIDYLQLMGESGKFKEARHSIEYNSRGIKKLQQDLQIPIVLLSQLSREAEKSRRPELHHLRETGAIEQDADKVLLLYDFDDTEDEINECNNYNLEHRGYTVFGNLCKNRGGGLGTTGFAVKRKYHRFGIDACSMPANFGGSDVVPF